MALPLSLTSTGFFKSGFILPASVSLRKDGKFVSRSSTRLVSVRSVQESEGPRRLVDIIRLVPDITRNYFKSPSRRALFGGISLLGGFYVAQTISLSFGALGVNDVIAAVICVLLTEYVTKFYYSRPKNCPPYDRPIPSHSCQVMDNFQPFCLLPESSLSRPEFPLPEHCCCSGTGNKGLANSGDLLCILGICSVWRHAPEDVRYRCNAAPPGAGRGPGGGGGVGCVGVELVLASEEEHLRSSYSFLTANAVPLPQ